MSQLRVNSVTDAGGTGSTYAPGHVVQVVSVTKTDTFSTASTGYIDITGMSASITPKTATSRILVMVDMYVGNEPAQGGVQFQLVRNSTPVSIGDANGSRTRASGYRDGGSVAMAPVSINFLDSPATTSAVTYKMQGKLDRTGTTNTLFVNRVFGDGDNGIRTLTASNITLVEIAQ